MRARRLASRLYTFLPLLIGLLTLITVIVGLVGLHKMEAALITSAGETLELAASEIAHKVDLFLDERARHAEALARTPLLRKEDPEALTHFLTQVRTTYPVYIWLGVMDANGRVVASTDSATIGADRSRSQSFTRVRATRALVWEDVTTVEGSTGMDGVGWSAPILDSQGRLLAVIAAYVGLPVFEEIQTRTIDLFATRHGFLSSIEYQFLTQDGQAFIDSDLSHKGGVNLKRLMLPSALLSESGQSGFVQEEHVRRHVPVITGYARTSQGYRSKRSGWSILIRAEEGDVLAPIRATLWKLILTGVLIYVPLLGFSLWAAWGLRREWVKARLERAHATAAETNYRLLLDSTGEGIYGLNRKGLCTFVNKAAAAMLGYEPEALLGKNTHEIIHHSRPDGSHYPAEECRIYGAFRTGEACRVDGELLWRRDGTAFPVVYTAHPIVKYGVVMGAVVTFMDITELKQAETALRQSEERFRQIAENSGHVFWMTTTDFSEILYISRAYEPMWGRSCESLYAAPTSWLDAIHPDDRERVREAMKVLTVGQSFSQEFRVVLPDGNSRWVRNSGYPIRGESGTVYRFAGIAEDITERKQAAEALRASKELFHSAFDDAAIGIALVAPDGRWLQVNRALCELVGYMEQELLATNFQAITHPDDLETDLSYVRQVLAGEIPTYQMEKRYIHKLGRTVWILLNVSLVRDLQGKPIFFIAQIQDITVRKRAEEALRQSEERLRQLLEEREQLSQDLHDNIIQSIFAVGLSLEEYKRRLSEDAGNGARTLGQAIATLNQVIIDVRGYIEADRGEDVTGEQLPRLLGRAAKSLTGSHAPDFRIDLDMPALSLLNPDAAKQVLFIAREAMSNSARHSGASHCDVFLREEDGHFQLEVKDDGIGFAAPVESAHGFGLGSMAARVRKLGGKIQILSQPGNGTRILVDFTLEGHYEGAQHDSRS